jgi:hypothetical protein
MRELLAAEAVLVLRLLFLEVLLHTQGAVAVAVKVVVEQGELVAAALVRLLLELLERQTQAVAVVVFIIVAPAQAVQALSLFATPAQFNISLVAQ